MEELPRVIATRSKGPVNEAKLSSEQGISLASAELESSFTTTALFGSEASVIHDSSLRVPYLHSYAGNMVIDQVQMNVCNSTLSTCPTLPEATVTTRRAGAFKPVGAGCLQSTGFRPFVYRDSSVECFKEEDQVAAAAQALTSLSSNNPESSHVAAPSPTPDFSEYPDAHSDHAAEKDMSPEANAGSLHPTPSPYQDSNADPDLGQMIKEQRLVPNQKSSNFKGVSWHKHSHKWYAYIQHSGKMHGLGYYHDEYEAARVYDAAARTAHGRKAHLNFPHGNSLAKSVKDNGQLSRANSMQPSCTKRRSTTWTESRGDSQQIAWTLDSMSLKSPFQSEAHLPQLGNGAGIAGHFETANSVRSPERVPAEIGVMEHKALDRTQTGRPRRRAVSARAPASNEPGSDSGDSSNGVVQDSWAQVPAVSGRRSSKQEDSEYEGNSPWAKAKGHSRPPMYGSRQKSQPAMSGSGQKALKSGSSQYKGVSWSERSRKWRAQMWYGNKVHHLGFFDNEEEAARVYDAAVLKLRGPSCQTNFDPRQAAGREPLKDSLVESMTNSSLPRVKSKFRGVRWHYCNRKWEARIFDGIRQVSLGYYDSQEEAAEAYDKEATRLRGSVAILNFPSKPQTDSGCNTRASERLQSGGCEFKSEGEDLLPPLPARWGSKRRRLGA